MRFISIKARVTIYFTLMMALVVGLTLIFMLIVGRSALVNNAESTLLDVVHDNIDNVRYEDGLLDLDNLRLYRHNVYILVYDANYHLIGGAGLRHFDGDEQFCNGETREVQIDRERYLVYDLCVQNQEGDVWLRGITSTENSSSSLHVILVLAVIFFPIIAIMTAAGGWLIARRAFLPVRQITDTVNAISDGDDLTARIGLKRGRDEIHRLGATFDRMFDRLERSFNAEKRFASDASHELRTPISVILAECEFARQNETVEEYRESMEVVERQARKMSELVNQLLSITRMDQGTHKAAMERASFSELVDVVCSEISRVNDKPMQFSREIEPELYAMMDVGMMTRLVQNLIENAYKYTPEGGSIKVKLRAEDSKLCFSVSDTGVGISSEDLPHIWDRFWQADPSRGVVQGSGLGLSMVKQIASIHDGKLDVESTPGRGSTFYYRMARCE